MGFRKFYVFFVLVCIPVWSGVNITSNPSGYEIKNNSLKVLVERKGGKITFIEYRNKKFNNIIIFDNRTFPGIGKFKLSEAIFKGEIVEGKGISLKYDIKKEDNRFLYGITVEKIITLLPSGSGIKIDLILKNNSDRFRKPGLVVENRKLKYPSFMFPSVKGVKTIKDTYRTFPLQNITGGWCGFSLNKAGVIFIFDYGNTSNFQVDLKNGRLKWQFDRVKIPPEKKVKFSTFIVFIDSINGTVFASPYIICRIKKNKDKITNFFEQSFYLLNKPLKVKTELIEWESGKVIKTENFENNKGLPLSNDITFPDSLKKHLLVKNYGKAGKIRFKCEKFFREDYPVYPEYKIIPPLKNRKIPKPENIQITGKKRVLLLKGLYYDTYKIEEAIKKIRNVEVEESYFYDRGYILNGTALTYFPNSYEKMFNFKLVIMGDIDGNCIGEEGRTYLKGFVESGGNLLVFGGPYSFGEGRIEGTYIEEILPVRVKEIFDLKKETGKIEKTKDCPGWIKWNKKNGGVVIWSHNVEIKKNAHIWLKSGGKPFLITSKYGKGNVFVFTGTNLGVAPEGEKGFWETEQWINMLSEIINYLLEN